MSETIPSSNTTPSSRMVDQVPWSRFGLASTWLLFAIGIGYFAWGAFAAAYSPSMDYAVVVDMARNMAAGKDFPVFFYGQAYMGSLEPAVSALICALFGPSPFCVCLGTALLGIAALLVTTLAGKRLAGAWGGFFSLLLAVTGGCHWFHFLVSPRGGYGLVCLLVVSALSLSVLGEFVDPGTGKVRRRHAALFGFMAGLAFWNVWLAFPAFAAAGLVILIRLRGRTFSPRFIIPALAAFFIGSAPWWLWTARNGLGALDLGGGGLRPSGLKALVKIFTVLLGQFYDTASSPSTFWRTPLPWTLAAILLFSLAIIALKRCRKQVLFLLATFLYAGFFAFVYAKSAFGTMGATRYLVPLVPVFSVLCGSALGASLSFASSGNGRTACWRRLPGAALATLYVLAVAVPAVQSSIRYLGGLHAHGLNWRRSVEAAARAPALSEAAFADFSLFGYNWASQRKICLVSPKRWRYQPYLDALEAAEHPAVVNDLFDFHTFCKTTGGTYRTRAVGDLQVTDEITPPVETAELLPASPIRIQTDDGQNVGDALRDDNLATGVRLRGRNQKEPYLDIDGEILRQCAGLKMMSDSRICAQECRVTLFNSDGEVHQAIDDSFRNGWFWSGPRQYQFGPDSRWTIRWHPHRDIVRIRIDFINLKPGASIWISDLRLLSDKPLPAPDADQLAQAVESLRAVHPDARVHTPRWLGPRLGADPDPALRFGALADDLGVPEICQFATLDPARTEILVFQDPSAAGAAVETLRALGLGADVREAGGHVLLTVLPKPASPTSHDADRPPLRFMGGRLFRDIPPPLDLDSLAPCDVAFGDMLTLKAHSKLPICVKAGDTLALETIWFFSPRSKGNKPIKVFLHGLANGKIVTQCAGGILPEKARRPADQPHPAPMTFRLPIPPTLPSGDIALALCIESTGPLSHRIRPSSSDRPVGKRRVLLGHLAVTGHGAEGGAASQSGKTP